MLLTFYYALNIETLSLMGSLEFKNVDDEYLLIFYLN